MTASMGDVRSLDRILLLLLNALHALSKTLVNLLRQMQSDLWPWGAFWNSAPPNFLYPSKFCCAHKNCFKHVIRTKIFPP